MEHPVSVPVLRDANVSVDTVTLLDGRTRYAITVMTNPTRTPIEMINKRGGL
jgi:hypothetical protein